jgi:transcriptional regulator with XRE-family HTH domain
MEHIAARVKELREARGMTQGQLADAAGVMRTYIVRLEAGRYDPRLSTILKLAKALRVAPEALLTSTRGRA